CRSGCLKTLTVDWDENINTQCLYGDDRLGEDMLCHSPDGKHNLLLERGTQAPEVEGERHYVVVIREIEIDQAPPVPQDVAAVVAFNMTPAGALFNKDILLTLGFDELPGEAEEATIAYFNDIDEVWVPLHSEPGEPNGVAELNLSTAVDHFSIFAVLVGLTPASQAHFVASDLNIAPSVERIWEPVTFVTKVGETVTITANIENRGGQAGTFDVVLKLNGEAVDSKTVTLSAGESRSVKFTVFDVEYGDYEVEVADLSGAFTASRTVNWPPIVIITVAIGLIAWGIAWAVKRRKARQGQSEIAGAEARLSHSNPYPIYYMFL
ncbi:MAG: CARDB domain-containing protein, partial [Dehalococcoidia bacterium]